MPCKTINATSLLLCTGEYIDLTFDDRFEKVMDKDGIWEVHTLTIKDAVMEDAGTYEVVASNRLGENAATGTLAIVTEPPTFPVELQVIYCKYSIFHFS